MTDDVATKQQQVEAENDITSLSSPAAKVIGRWPEGAIVYQVYPRSLQDSNGDGIGDLPGITGRLDYIKSLGVNAIWLSPFYPSPMADFGYDISDLCSVDPVFGTLEDFKRLLDACHERDIKVMLDTVPNHTSDEHQWFQESRKSAFNRYAKWYVWRDAKGFEPDGAPIPPNNWRDAFAGRSAWQWDEGRKQFYLHSFHAKQPDLNWSNASVREAIKQAWRFWLDMGVDGFRVDAVYWMGKDPLFRDDGPNPDYIEGEDSPYEALDHANSRGWPTVFAYLAELDSVLKEKPYQHKPRFMVTEPYPSTYNPVSAYLAFYAGVDPLVAAPFNFEGILASWEADSWHRFLKSYHEGLKDQSPLCVPCYAYGNHDKPRIASRIGEAAARGAAVLFLTLPGMIFMYYGDELGMHDVHIPPELVQDPEAKGDQRKSQGRDPQRTPMQWTAEPMSGFTDSGSSWLPIGPDHAERNVEVQSRDPGSFLSLYRQLGKLRNGSAALKHGEIDVLDLQMENVLAYTRSYGDEKYLVLVNFADEAATCTVAADIASLVLSSEPQTGLAGIRGRTVSLRPHESAVLALR